jgi:hypothetical protein
MLAVPTSMANSLTQKPNGMLSSPAAVSPGKPRYLKQSEILVTPHALATRSASTRNSDGIVWKARRGVYVLGCSLPQALRESKRREGICEHSNRGRFSPQQALRPPLSGSCQHSCRVRSEHPCGKMAWGVSGRIHGSMLNRCAPKRASSASCLKGARLRNSGISTASPGRCG